RKFTAGSAAIGTVACRDERSRDLHDRQATLVGRRAEAGEVADDAAAERDEGVAAVDSGLDQRRPDRLGGGKRLAVLARADRDFAEQPGELIAVQRPDGLIGHA